MDENSIKADLKRLTVNTTISGLSEGEAILAKGILLILEKLSNEQPKIEVVSQ